MTSKTLAAALLVAACVAAAATGGYVAARHNAAERQAFDALPDASPASPQPVSETETIVGTPATAPAEAPAPQEPAPTPVIEQPVPRPAPARRPRARDVRVASARTETAAEPAQRPVEPSQAEPDPLPSPPVPEPPPEPARTEIPAESWAQFEEVVLPASSVIGVQVETPLSSERSQVEDRVEARVTRDVTAAGRIAIPAGSRMLGAVTVVERGGKIKERARLGIRFHTLVLANGHQVALRTEPIYREGDPPSSESSRKIGGAAVGGAILGAILGGGKGAAIGGAAGGAAGTAAVMAGDRNAATLAAGTVVTVRLAAPATVEIDRR